LRGQSGIEKITLFDSSGYETRIAAEVKNFDEAVLKKKHPRLKNASRGTFFAVEAAHQAVHQAGLGHLLLQKDFEMGLYMAIGDGGEELSNWAQALLHAVKEDSFCESHFFKEALLKIQSELEIEKNPAQTLLHLVNIFSIRGPVSNCLTACAASSQAIGEAFEWIRRGDLDVVMTGGVHAMIYPMGVAGFSCLQALSKRNETPHQASRPFDKNRDGFVMGEGAGILILESEEHAKQRGARVLGEVAGYGSTADAYRPTDMTVDGSGASRAMFQAFEKAKILPEEIDYINAHGTSTAINDRSETLAIKKTFSDKAYDIPVSSIKSMIGHPIAAAGAIEIIACLYAINTSIIPPTLNYEVKDVECDLDYVPNKARKKELKTVLSNSFGFGGQNICLILKKYEDGKSE
jgi:3-oxoacyl-[acyl-carrier-protein] synthase II